MDNRWAALVLGVALVAVLARLPVPYLGSLVRLGVLALGAGVLVLGLRAVYGIVRSSRAGTTAL